MSCGPSLRSGNPLAAARAEALRSCGLGLSAQGHPTDLASGLPDRCRGRGTDVPPSNGPALGALQLACTANCPSAGSPRLHCPAWALGSRSGRLACASLRVRDLRHPAGVAAASATAALPKASCTNETARTMSSGPSGTPSKPIEEKGARRSPPHSPHQGIGRPRAHATKKARARGPGKE